jgi:hypothetical protein
MDIHFSELVELNGIKENLTLCALCPRVAIKTGFTNTVLRGCYTKINQSLCFKSILILKLLKKTIHMTPITGERRVAMTYTIPPFPSTNQNP